MCVSLSGKCAIIFICLLAFLIAISDGLKCLTGLAKTGSGTDAYQMLECEGGQNACFIFDCADKLAGSTAKGCNSKAIYGNDVGCDASTSKCHSDNGLTSGVRACSICKGDLCNSVNPNDVSQCNFTMVDITGTNIDVDDMKDGNGKVDTLLGKIKDDDVKGMINDRKNKEYFTTDGFSMGLPGFKEKSEKIPIDDDPRPPTKNFDIVEDGNDAMIQKLSDWADQGGAMRKLIKASPELFNNKESGFVKSQVRYVRTLHCIQKIAYLLKKSEKDTGKKVEYAIGGIWIGGKIGSPTSIKNGEDIEKAMKNVTTLKKEIGELVNDGEFDWAKVHQKREDLAAAIKNVANLEQKEGGSSMDLMGLIYVNGKDAKEDQYFVHIAANDHYKPDEHKDEELD